MDKEILICPYCRQPWDGTEGFHGCPQSRDAQDRVDKNLEKYIRIAKRGETNFHETLTTCACGCGLYVPADEAVWEYKLPFYDEDHREDYLANQLFRELYGVPND